MNQPFSYYQMMFTHSYACGGDGIASVCQSFMSEYEKETIPRKLATKKITRKRLLYDYDVLDLFYVDCKSFLPSFTMAIDSHIESTMMFHDQEYGYVPDFIRAEIHFYNEKKDCCVTFDIQFWATSFAMQKHWFQGFISRRIRAINAEVNWLLRKNFALAFHKNVHAAEACAMVFNNYYLKIYIGKFL